MQDSAALQALLNPKSIVLVGASSDPTKNTARPLRFMRKHGYSGKIFPVNAGQSEVLGERAYKDLTSLPEPVDHVFIMIPGAHVMGLLEQCAQAGAKLVTVYSDGFAESGEEGIKQQAALVEKAQALGLRILGPNSIGSANLHSGAILSVNAAFESDELNVGDIALVSQSGSMMGSLFSRAAKRGFGFSHLISVGNESDVSVGEVIDALVDDTKTRSILLFLETVRKPDVLAKALKRARAAGKPVIVYKLGRSKQGETLSQSHTGALAGNDAAIDAFLRQHGALRVDFLETLFEMIPLAVNYSHAPRPPFGSPKRVAVITTTGGGAATVVDRLGLCNIDATPPPIEFIQKMAECGLKITQAPVIDLTLAATSVQYKTLLEELLRSDWCDAVLAVVGSSAQFHAALAIAPLVEADKPSTKPLVAFLTPEASESLRLLKKHNIASFRTPEACADAMAAFFSQCPPQDADTTVQKTFTWPAHLPRTGNLSEYQALSVWEALGIGRAKCTLITDADLKHDIPYPVALKVSSRDILHKTDVAGVRLGIGNDQELSQALSEIQTAVKLAAPEAKVDGFLVQHMESRLIELILGFRLEPLVGPIVVLGAGGISAELNADSSIRLAPVTKTQAHEMISEVRHTELIRGFRNLPRGDCNALANAIVAFSHLACVQDVVVSEAEINPLFVQNNGVLAVDGLICLN
ncbi:MAG: acetate--CoA ligase family protein [Burkholderiaceae bacterium]|nr:acetate--CoA ligase family protein [Burkholderiaceae bacterium]